MPANQRQPTIHHSEPEHSWMRNLEKQIRLRDLSKHIKPCKHITTMYMYNLAEDTEPVLIDTEHEMGCVACATLPADNAHQLQTTQ